MELKSLNADYQSGQQIYWTGRKSNPDLGKQYWNQEIELIDLYQIKNENTIDIALLGYVCDEGVRRNLGRIGAAKGPKMIRERLAKLLIHFDEKRVVDAGDIICIEEDIESCQQVFTNTIF